MKKNHYKNLTSFSVLIFICSLYLYDLSNPYGIRQGSEALYLQASKEMFELKSWLTPYYLGERHWSKPPAQFWLPFPLYAIFGKTTLGLAKSAVAIFSLFSITLFARWMKRNNRSSFLTTFIVIAGSLAFIKYSRTFMMEIMFSALPALSLLYFYEYLEKDNKKSFICSLVLGAFGCLVKGPVSLVLSFGGLGLFFIISKIKKEFISLKKLILYAALLTALSSIWFVWCYIEYGKEFLDYFFLRENLGKLGNKNVHSGWKVFQGLLIYSLPWIFFVPSLIKRKIERLDVYLISFFIVFFLVWFVPAQKSHHYAIPAIPFLLCLIIPSINNTRPHNSMIFAMGGLLSLVLTIVGYISGEILIWINFALSLGALFLYKRKDLSRVLLVLSMIFLWSVSISLFFIPTIPKAKLNVFDNISNVHLADRRAYFFSTELKREVKAISPGQVNESLKLEDTVVIFYESRLKPSLLTSPYKTLTRWRKWKRKVKWKHIKAAFIKRDINELKEFVYVVEGN